MFSKKACFCKAGHFACYTNLTTMGFWGADATAYSILFLCQLHTMYAFVSLSVCIHLLTPVLCKVSGAETIALLCISTALCATGLCSMTRAPRSYNKTLNNICRGKLRGSLYTSLSFCQVLLSSGKYRMKAMIGNFTGGYFRVCFENRGSLKLKTSVLCIIRSIYNLHLELGQNIRL